MAHELRLCSHFFFFFWMWNRCHIAWQHGGMVTDPLLQFCCFLSVPFWMYCLKSIAQIGWPDSSHGTFRQSRPRTSQLFALQHGLSGGAGEEDGAGLRRGEHWLDVKPLARQSCVAAACARSLPHGGRDALMPLCWRCSRQLVLLLRVPRLQTLYKFEQGW